MQGILSDLFPGVELPDIDYNNLKDALKANCAKLGLQPLDTFLEKIIQLCAHSPQSPNPKPQSFALDRKPAFPQHAPLPPLCRGIVPIAVRPEQEPPPGGSLLLRGGGAGTR